MMADRVASDRYVGHATVALLVACLSIPALANTPDQTPAPCDLREDIWALNDSIRELVDVLRLQTEIAAAEGLANQVLALDSGIASLDSSLREVLRERNEVAVELVSLRAGYDTTARAADDPANSEGSRTMLSSGLLIQSGNIARCEERLAHLEARAIELRETLGRRQLKRAQLEDSLGGVNSE